MIHNPLATQITPLSLIKFTFPTIIMMIFISTYSIVDGIFVARFLGTNALSAANIVNPFFGLVLATGIMLATGGSAFCGFQMGVGNEQKAKESFSFIVLIGTIAGLIIGGIGFFFSKEIVTALGANTVLLQDSIDYARLVSLFVPFFILQVLFQYFFVTAGKPALGLIVTILAGLTNIILDYVFIVPMGMGITGAALATSIGFVIPVLFGLAYFSLCRNGSLYFVKPGFDLHTLKKSCSNGLSEMVNNLATAITTFLFNIMMMRLVGEDGVAAITIILYTQFLTTALYLGYSSGVAPLISYNYGNDDQSHLKKLIQYSLLFILISSLLVFIVSFLIAEPIVRVFTIPDSSVYVLALRGYRIFVLSVLFAGSNIFASAMFTAFSDGKTSVIISFLRTFAFLVSTMLLLPILIGIDGIWIAIPLAEILTLVISIIYFVKKRKLYHY